MGIENSIFPIDVISPTQLSGGGSHVGTEAMDFIGTTLEYPIIAPFRCKMVNVYSRDLGTTLFIVSCNEYGEFTTVQTPYEENIVSVSFTHTNKDQSYFQNHINNETIFEQGDVIYWTGNSGISYGDHVHIQCGYGVTKTFNVDGDIVTMNNEQPLINVFFKIEGYHKYIDVGIPESDFPLNVIDDDGIIGGRSAYNFIYVKGKIRPIRKR